MSQAVPMREKIITAAEKRVRNAGFPAMSFRDIAQDVGVKSASVHYHFPTKEDLGEALIDNYTDRFREKLDNIDRGKLADAVDEFIQLYADGLIVDEAICMCAILGAEALGLPSGMKDRTKYFFEMNAQWLTTLFAEHGFRNRDDLAFTIVSALEGAIIVASTSNDQNIFDRVAETIRGIAKKSLV